ncbi:MAG: phosphoribosylformylglycinamidine synthase subunit PurL, partial [Alphaproteobacteria bacterium]|nr:phosphoribosylformylglycinamidine synthase subunit PurL [Alphaproteobacteria bacterium]
MAAPQAKKSDELPADLMGLSEAEYKAVLDAMGRTPNRTELGIFSVMWSEHCSYKSSRKWLKTLPTDGPQVICGPGENAGVVDIGDGLAAVFKIESHNHPSFIEPHQGAATGVGGIMRDVFTMGARPIANLNALRFGATDHARTRHLVSGVVAGIGGYGNCMGVPTVGGEMNFHGSYNGNPLVNAMTVGLAKADRIFYSAAAGAGLPVVYVGSKTGRDGIHGATMASAEFDDEADAKRPTVQVGDPFTEKLLLEACLELMQSDAIVAIQDMGAAGLTSSSVEMASKGGVGFAIDLDRVPRREEGMTAYELMLSESQERMLMVLHPGAEQAAGAIFEKWELDFAVIGQTDDSGRLRLSMDGEIVADIPIAPLVDAAPEYDRPWTETRLRAPIGPADILEPADPPTLGSCLRRLVSCPDMASRRWVWEQYDSMVMTDTAAGPGGDAAVVRVHGTRAGLAMTTDCTPRYVFADPKTGGAQAVAEAWRNLTCVGATPLAITNNLNFGNPERPEIMGQLVGAVTGMGDACRALDFPVVSGNVSLYNETVNGETGADEAIMPTPVVGGLGLIDDTARVVSMALDTADLALVVIGGTTDAAQGWLGASLFLAEIAGRHDGAPPPVDLAAERRAGDFVRHTIAAGRIEACHDISDGGLLATVAEMSMAGGTGAALAPPI